MKTMILLTVAFLSLNTYASTFKCEWLNEGIVDSDQFYRPASFVIDFNKTSSTISEDTFFNREYRPCWTGGFESCSFNFELPVSGVLNIEKQKNNTTHLSFESVTGYGVGNMEFLFAKKVSRVEIGEAVKAVLTGDDGEGTFLNETYFSCQRLQ